MSAFRVLLSSQHVSAIVDYARWNCWRQDWVRDVGTDVPTLDEPQALGELLFAENVRSVRDRDAHRHPDTIGAPTFTFQEGEASGLDAVAVLKLIDCLERQSSGCDDYYTTRAWHALQSLRLVVIRALPGYVTAPWEI